MGESKDAALVRTILGGDLAAFTTLFAQYEQRVWRYASSIVRSNDDADDVVQQAFIKAYRNLRTYDLRRPFSSWLYRIVRNEALNWRRAHRKEITGEAATIVLENQVDRAEGAHERVERKELQTMVQACLRQLPLEYREPLVLYYIDERSYEEISDILRLPANTVATRLRRGKHYLKTLYEKQAGATHE